MISPETEKRIFENVEADETMGKLAELVEAESQSENPRLLRIVALQEQARLRIGLIALQTIGAIPK